MRKPEFIILCAFACAASCLNEGNEHIASLGVAKMGSLSHPSRNPNLSLLRWVLSGQLLEPPGAFWGILGSVGNLFFPLESPGIFLGRSWGLLGVVLGYPSPFMWLRLHKWGRIRFIQAGKVQNATPCLVVYLALWLCLCGGRAGGNVSFTTGRARKDT